MFNEFKTRAEGVGAEVYRFKTKKETTDFLMKFMKKEGVGNKKNSYALWNDSNFLKDKERKSISEKVPGLKFEVNRQYAADALVGICEMSYALADTGSLVADQTSINDRLVSTLPVIHIALVGTGNILKDKVAVLKKIKPGKSGFIAFITGPSRTADIERVLTIGVHGPKRLVIVFIDEIKG